MAADEHPDVLVLLDLGLPDMFGWVVARKLQDLPSEKKPFLIAVTGLTDEEARRHTQQAGVDLHLAKPVDPTQLLQLLDRFHAVIA